MAIKFPIQVDINGSEKAKREIDDLGKSADKTKDALKDMIAQTAAFAGLSLGAAGLKEFVGQIIDVRKEMQGYNISLTTLLGNQDKANAMFNELKEFAVTTPLMFKDLASGAQTMLGFNIEAEKVVPTLKAIGDISMGDAQKFQSLTLAFSQMSATGKLMGQDLLQMINTGFNPLAEIAVMTGKSMSELKDEMSAGAISAEMVAEAFEHAVGPEGKFFGMLEKQGKGLAGQINTLKGAIDDMFNSLGEQSEGIIIGSVNALTSLVKNYEKVGQALEALIIAYGSYKTALILVQTVEMSNAVGIGMTVKSLWASVTATKAATLAQTAFNAVAKANPYVLIVTAVIAAATAIFTFAKRTDEAAEAQKRLNRATDEFNKKQEEEAEKVKKLIDIIQDKSATDNQHLQAYAELGIRCEELTKKYSLEQLAVMNLTDAYKELNKVQEQESMANLAEDTAKKVRVYEELERILSGKQRHGSAETQQFIKDNGLAGMNYKKIMSILKGQIDSQSATLDQYNANQSKSQDSGLTYQQEAKLVYDDWQEAKRTYEKLVNSQTATKEQVKKAKDEMERFDKEYEELTGSKASSKNKGSKSGDKQKWTEDDAREQQLNTDQAVIEAMEDGAEKKLRQIDLNYAKEKEAIRKEEAELRKLRAGGQLTDEDQEYLDAREKAATAKHEQAVREQTEADAKAQKERTEEEEKAMNDYLAMYGSMQQKRQAITASYTKKIADATTEGEKLALQKGLEEALSDLDMEAFKSDVNWEAIFGDLGKYTKKQLQTIQAQLKTYKDSDEYAKATVENKKVVDEALNNIQQEISSKSGIFGNIGEALNRLSAAEKELAEATAELDKATTETEKATAKKKVQKAQQNVDTAEADVRTSAETARDRISSLASTITQLGTASEISLSDIGSLGKSIAGMFGDLGEKVGGWIGAIFTICDMIARDGLEGLIQNVGKSLGQFFGGLLGFDIDKNTREYEQQKKLHDNYISLIRETISKQEELMKQQSGLDAYDTFKDAEDKYQSIINTRKNDIFNYLNAGASKGFLGMGSSSSNGKELYDKLQTAGTLLFWGGENASSGGISAKAYLQYQEIFGDMDKRVSQLGTATVDQIKQLKECFELWSILPDEIINYYNEILAADEAMQNLKSTLDETYTASTFDEFKDSFFSTLEDMNSEVDDFTQDLEKKFNKALVNAMINKTYNDKLKEWYNGFASAMKNGIENLTKTQVDELRQGYTDIVNQARDEAQRLRDVLGITANVENAEDKITPTQRSIQTMSEETGTELNGRFTAIQISNQDIADRMSESVQAMLNIGSTLGSMNSTLNDINVAILATNSQLAQIYSGMTKGFENSDARMGEIVTTINTKL